VREDVTPKEGAFSAGENHYPWMVQHFEKSVRGAEKSRFATAGCCRLRLPICADRTRARSMTPPAVPAPLSASDGAPELAQPHASSHGWVWVRRSITIFFLFWAVYFAVHWIRSHPDRITFIQLWTPRGGIELAVDPSRAWLSARPDMRSPIRLDLKNPWQGRFYVEIYSWAPVSNVRREREWFVGKVSPSIGGLKVICPLWFAVSLSLGIALSVWPWRVRRRSSRG
jgi:hypothetical protein